MDCDFTVTVCFAIIEPVVLEKNAWKMQQEV